MKQIAPKKYAISLYEVLESTDASQQQAILASFVQLLVRHKMLAKLDKIINYFKLYADEQANIKTVKLNVAQPLDQTSRQNIINHLEKILKYKIEIVEETQPDLIGGVMIEYDDIRIDGSIKKQLTVMTNQFKS